MVDDSFEDFNLMNKISNRGGLENHPS